MKVLGIIPARGGSRRLPGKNMADLGGRPLVQWTIAAAQASRSIDWLVVSTDSDVVRDHARVQDDCVVHWRHGEQPVEGKPMIERVREVVDARCRWDFDTILLLQPTSPFRIAGDITASLAMFSDRRADVVVSVTDMLLDWVYDLGFSGRLTKVAAKDWLVVPNGAIYIISRRTVEDGYDWWTCPGTIFGYKMPSDRSIDIDTIYDLERARETLAKGLPAT